MPKTRAHVRSSRRVPELRDSEIDHEISLVDNSAPIDAPQSPTTTIGDTIDHSISSQPLIPPESRAPSTQPPETETENAVPRIEVEDEAGPSGGPDTSRASREDASTSIAGKEPPSKGNGLKKISSGDKRRARPSKEPETAMDILYENQRGGFLCGLPLFSSAALGQLDPPPWTNFAHKPSPTDINTAQVPDPSWEWAWPEWRINRDEAIKTDGDGWEYSFMFSKKFSWHGPKWYNSFVRRRAWIRRRIKKGFGYLANNDPRMSLEYFSVTPTRNDADRGSISQLTAHASVDSPRKSRESKRGEEEIEIQIEITSVDELMTVLRRSRIDREKLEAVENYIEHCADDLHQLQDYMHEIMSLFVFQASRKLLLARLIKLHDDEVGNEEEDPKGKSAALQQKAENLAEAIKHADEEVRRLEYWSDIKGMADSGESRGAVEHGKGWGRDWEGLDKSGPRGVKGDGELPK
ncbi:hypothetical protein F5Y04DRAFT_242981 [Hypomontagnella monticulosa]|nr:hypothetical protein F5Y04DRAFT_242981 [Hypomontagnella monticulosa]